MTLPRDNEMRRAGLHVGHDQDGRLMPVAGIPGAVSGKHTHDDHRAR